MKLTQQQINDIIDKLTKNASERGHLVAIGWQSFKLTIPAQDKDDERRMQMAFYAGTQHLFSSIMTMMDEGAVETEADLRKMDRINRELNHFALAFSAAMTPRGAA